MGSKYLEKTQFFLGICQNTPGIQILDGKLNQTLQAIAGPSKTTEGLTCSHSQICN